LDYGIAIVVAPQHLVLRVELRHDVPGLHGRSGLCEAQQNEVEI